MSKEQATDLSGAERAAVFLMSLSEKEAAEVMRHMPAAEVQRLGKAMAAMRKVSRGMAESVLTQFTDTAEREPPGIAASPAFLKRVLSGSLGEEKANQMLERLIDDDSGGLDSLQMMEAREITELVHREHPQVIAVMLAGLEAAKSAQVIAQLPVAMATDVVARIASLQEIPRDTIQELDEVMHQRFSQAGGTYKVTTMGGVRSAAEILNLVRKDVEHQIIEALNSSDPPLCQQIQDNMFVFENLLKIDDRGIQALAREVTSDILVLALKGADAELQDKIFRNMSKRTGELLRDELAAKGPVRLTEVEAAQKEIVGIARRLAEEGTIMLGTGGDDFV
jgi:flagellar motor switch protein FliG